MPIDIGTLIIGTEPPSGNINSDANCDDWVWLNPTTGAMHKFNPATGQYDINVPVPVHAESHEHEGLDKINQLGTIHFRENVFAGVGNDNKGITEDIVLSKGTLSIKKGIVVGWTPT